MNTKQLLEQILEEKKKKLKRNKRYYCMLARHYCTVFLKNTEGCASFAVNEIEELCEDLRDLMRNMNDDEMYVRFIDGIVYKIENKEQNGMEKKTLDK